MLTSRFKTKNWSLRIKLLASHLAVALIPSLIFSTIFYLVLLSNLTAIEESEARRSLKQVEQAIALHHKDLEATLLEYSVWSESYRYVQNPTAEFDEYLDWLHEGRKVDLVLFLSPSGRIIGQRGACEEYALGKNLRDSIFWKRAKGTTQESGKDIFSGFLRNSRGVCAISGAQIWHTDHSGPPLGAVILGKQIDTAYSQELSEWMGVDVQILPMDSARAGEKITFLDGQRLQIESTLMGLDDAPAGIVRLIVSRNLFNEVKKSLWTSYVFILVTAFLFTIILSTLFSSRHLRQIRSLKSAMFRTISSNDYSHRLTPMTDDELGDLERAFNVLLENLEKTYGVLTTKNTELEGLLNDKDQLISILSHEIRTPLGGITAYIDMTLNRDALTDESRNNLLLINREVERLSKLLYDILEVNRMELGKLPFHMNEFPVKTLIEYAYLTFLAKAQQAGIKLICEDNSSGALIHGDIERLHQALINIIDNALKHTPTGGTVHLSAALHPLNSELIRITIADTGSGIPEEFIPKIFNKFIQASREEEKKGSGLGMTVVKLIVDRHNAQISVESVPGMGTKIHIDIPTASSPDAPKETVRPS